MLPEHFTCTRELPYFEFMLRYRIRVKFELIAVKIISIKLYIGIYNNYYVYYLLCIRSTG